MLKTTVLLAHVLAMHCLRMQQSHAPNPPKGLEWPLLIDGKDAKFGPHAYDGHGMQAALEDALPFVMNEDELGDLTIEVAMKIHRQCCSDIELDGSKVANEFRGFSEAPFDGFWETECFLKMSCEEQQAALADVPKDLLTLKPMEGKPGCFSHIRSLKLHPTVVKDKFKILIQNYSDTSKQVVGASFQVRLTTLARMLHNLAWLHPFTGSNGRFRTLLLQREIRRLGLGSGSFMYNNNRDVFHIGLDVYMSKIEEGIRMFDASMQINKNAWLDDNNVRNHFKQFPEPANGSCPKDEVAGSIS